MLQTMAFTSLLILLAMILTSSLLIGTTVAGPNLSAVWGDEDVAQIEASATGLTAAKSYYVTYTGPDSVLRGTSSTYTGTTGFTDYFVIDIAFLPNVLGTWTVKLYENGVLSKTDTVSIPKMVWTTDSTYATMKTSFAQGETVYFKAIGLLSTKYYKFMLDPPSGSNVYVPATWQTGVTELTGSYLLPEAAPTGSWKLHVRQADNDKGGKEQHYMDRYFTVVAAPPPTVSITIASDPAGPGFVKVDGGAITTPQTYNWVVGSTHSLEALSPVPDGAGVQFVYTGWSDGGAQTHNYVVPGSAATVTANYKTQYYLTVTSTYDTPGGMGWYDSGATAYATLVDGTVYDGPSKRYVFTGWSGDASGTGLTSDPITMNAPKTAVAQWKTQWKVTFAVSPSGAGSTNPSVGDQWLDEGSNSISASANAGYQFFRWTATGSISFGDQYSASTSATVGGSGTITANFKVLITIASSPAGSGFVEVDDSPITTPTAFAWEAGTTHKLEALSPVSAGLEKQYLFTGWSDAGAQTHDYVVPSAPEIVTASYKTQVKLSFTHTGLDSTASGTVVTVEGSPKAWGDLPFTTGWLDSGSSITFGYEAIVASSSANKRFALVSTSHSSPLTVPNDPVTIYGNYKTQFYVIFGQSGIGSDTGTNTVVTIGASNKKAGDLPVGDWFDSGTTYSYAATVATSDPGKQYVLTGVSGPTSPIADGGAVTGNYKTQYYLTVTSAHDTPGGDGWYDSGATAYATLASGTVDDGPNKRYVFTGWSGDASGTGLTSDPITMNAPKTAVAQWKTQWKVTITQSGVGVDFTGTVVVVDALSYGVGALPASFWWDDGSTHSFAFQSPLVVTPNAKRYVWTSTSGLSSLQAESIVISAAGSMTGNYKTQYYLTMSTNYGSVSPASGWYDAGSKVSISATAPAVIVGERYVWLGWTGTGTISYTGLLNPAINQVTMNGPVSEAAAWRREFLLTVFSEHDSPVPSVGQHWFPIGTVVDAFVISPWLDPDGTRYNCTGWTGTGSVPPSGTTTYLLFSLTAPSNLTWNWMAQYYLTVTSAHGTTGGEGWYNAGATAFATVTPLALPEVDGTRIVFTGWSVDATGSTSPSNPIIMDRSKTAVATWDEEYYLNVTSAYDTPTGSGWYRRNALANFGVTTPVDLGNGTIRYFVAWSGDATGTEPTGSIVMTKPSKVIASWRTQYLITFNTTLPNNVALHIPNIPEILPPGLDIFGAYFDEGSTAQGGPAPALVEGPEGTRYLFEGWSVDGQFYTSEPDFALIADAPHNVAVVYATELLLRVRIVGLTDYFTATLTLTLSPPASYSLTPVFPVEQWVRMGTPAVLAISSPHALGYGEWAVFKQWSGDAQGTGRTTSLTVNSPKTADAVFFKTNPVAESIPYSVLGGLACMAASYIITRRQKGQGKQEEKAEGEKKNEDQGSGRSLMLGLAVSVVAIVIAAIVSSGIASGYGINPGELLDFSNWAVLFLCAEAIVLLALTAVVTRRLPRATAAKPTAAAVNPYGI